MLIKSHWELVVNFNDAYNTQAIKGGLSIKIHFY